MWFEAVKFKYVFLTQYAAEEENLRNIFLK